MATVIWRGGAPTQAEVNDWTFSGTWASSASTVTLTIGSKSVSVVIGSTVISTIVDTLFAAWNALSASIYPEFAECTASKDGTTDFRLTADTAGRPIGTVTLSTNDGTGVIGSQTVVTANKGPNDWGSAMNWSGAAVPVSTDDVVLELSNDEIKYGLDQNAVDLTSLTIKQSFTGTLGLPLINSDGTEYYEHRQKDLKIGFTTLTIGQGEGQGSTMLNINGDATAFTANIHHTGQSTDENRYALRLLGTSTSNVLHLMGGEVDFAYQADDGAHGLATLNVGYIDNVASDSKIRVGSGVTPLTTVNIRGGIVELNSNAVTINQTDGETTTLRAMTVTTINLDGGTMHLSSSGTVTTLNIGSGAVADFMQDMRAKTVTTCNAYATATIGYLVSVVTFTNGIVCNRCKLEEVAINAGDHIKATITAA